MAGVSAVVARGSNEPMVGWPRVWPRPGLPAPGLRAPGRGGAEAGGREVGPGHGRRWHQPTIGRVAGAGSGRGYSRLLSVIASSSSSLLLILDSEVGVIVGDVISFRSKSRSCNAESGWAISSDVNTSQK